MSYDDFIENARLIREIESVSTTGDVAYNGTALEISDVNKNELFHFVISKDEEIQILFIKSKENYRMPVALLESILLKVHEIVKKID